MQRCSKYYTLYKNQFIKKIMASVLLIVFAISITPTIFFHNLFANHVDSVKKRADTKGEQLDSVTFNCHCDNVVATSPFTQAAAQIFPSAELILSSSAVEKEVAFKSSLHLFYSLRGPPLFNNYS